MSRKLRRDEYIESIRALQKFYFEKDNDNEPFSVNIIIKDRNSGDVERLETNVTIVYDNMSQRINIMWEDARYTVEEFRNKGLFGYYDCTWVPMSF